MCKPRPEGREHPFWGILCIFFGLFPILVVTGFIPFGQSEINAPGWVIFVVGSMFMLGGVAIMIGHSSPLNDLIGSLLCACFGVAAAWVSLRGSDNGFSGGIPLVPDQFNVMLGRVLFALGAALSFLISIFSFRRFLHRLVNSGESSE